MALPTLNKLANNFHNIECDGVLVWFFYETMIAFAVGSRIFCRHNEWGNTTGKHLNTIQPDHSKRMSAVDFEAAWDRHVTTGTIVDSDTLTV